MSEKQSAIPILFPDLSPEELKEADEVLRRYFAFIIRLYNRINTNQKQEQADFLTEEQVSGNKDTGRTFTSKYDDTNI
jgi:hypothetical protein